MEKISTAEEFEQILQKHSQFLFLKHSTTCPISQAGYDEVAKFASENGEIPTYFLHVQESRPLSNYISEKFAIKHESPQVFLIKEQKVNWHASHWDITFQSISKHI